VNKAKRDLLGHERITGRFKVRRAYKCSAELTAQYSWVLRGSLEEKYANNEARVAIPVQSHQ